MRKILFYLNTANQLISALNIIDSKLQPPGELNCILSDRLISQKLKYRIKSLGIFRNIYTVPTQRPTLKKWLSSRDIRRVYPFNSLVTNILKKNTSYLTEEIPSIYCEAFQCLRATTDIFFHTDQNSLLALCNKSCKRHLIDEGTRSYTLESLQVNPDCIYLYEPELAKFANIQTVKIKKISSFRSQLIEWLDTVFPTAPLSSNDIFFDQPLGKRPYGFFTKLSKKSQNETLKFRARIEIIKLATKIADTPLILRLHPGTNLSQKRYLSKLFNTKSSSAPFEIELLKTRFSTLNLYTIYSTAICYFLLIFDEDQFRNSSINLYIFLPTYIELSQAPIDPTLMAFFQKLSKKHTNIHFITSNFYKECSLKLNPPHHSN